MSLDNEIDEFARKVEKEIIRNDEVLRNLPAYRFGRNLRRTSDDHIVDLGELGFERTDGGD